jgi:cysteinyl-tRNA synthetase
VNRRLVQSFGVLLAAAAAALRAFAADPLPLAEVGTWAYQIQAVSEAGAVDALAASSYDLLVLEPTRTDWSSDDRHFDARAMVARLKETTARDNVHRKLVLAYIDIGQAEDWRWYWTWSTEWSCAGPKPSDWPPYILACDPDGWGGNYPVAYWDPAWKDIVLYGQNTGTHPDRDYTSIVDEAVRDGFDGVYLDWVEGFENDAVVAAAAAAGIDPEAEMIALIREIRDYARSRVPGFLVIQQNGSALAAQHGEVFEAVDAIAQEGIWYEGVATDDWEDPEGYDLPVDPDLTQEYFANLVRYQAAGLPVLDCEYALAYATEAYALAYAAGYVPYATRRSLGRLTTTPPPASCSVSCSASAPASALAGVPAAFQGTATTSGPCAGSAAFAWDFGDGQTSALQNPSHAYDLAGIYGWTLTVSADSARCAQAGSITVLDVPPPVVASLRKAGSPFRIAVTGANFQEGIRVSIGGTNWETVLRKDANRLVLRGGSALKAAVPKNTPTLFRFINPDGGETSVTWQWP